MYNKSFTNKACHVPSFERCEDGREPDVCSLKFRPPEMLVLEKRLNGISRMNGWTLGECIVLNDASKISIFRAFDKERREHWLCTGPWQKWQLVSDLWVHLDSINRMMLDVSPLFQALGPMLPAVRWLKTEEGFFGIAERRSDTPFLEYLKDKNHLFRFENIVQMAGFLRFLQMGNNVFTDRNSHKIVDTLGERTAGLIEQVKERIPHTPRFSRWSSFVTQNAKSVAHGGSLVLSLGVYAPTCFAYARSSALLVDYPFLLSEDVVHADLCRILFELRTRDPQDLKCLIDVYFDRDVPSYFFAQFAHHQLFTILEKLASSAPGSSQERNMLEEFDKLSQDYEHFRTPVPCWYK